MGIFRFIGYGFVILALAALGYEAAQAVANNGWQFFALGELWFKLDAHSLNISQSAIQRYISPWFWEPIITSVLLCPCWSIFGGLGLILIWLGRKSLRRKRWFH